MEAEFYECFQEIFTYSSPCQAEMDVALEGLLPKVT